jgi:nicotinamide riboside kinase
MDYRRIVITGPESSGKTTLAQQLSSATGWPWVPEFARAWLEARGGQYHRADLLTMARGQEDALRAATRQHPVVIADTDHLTYWVWDQHKYGSLQPDLIPGFPSAEPSAYLVCSPDLPWETDPLRESPHQRVALFEAHLQWLEAHQQTHAIIAGTDRLAMALQQIAAWRHQP